MTIFARPTFIAYARPTRERLVTDLIADMASAGERPPGFAFSLANANPGNVASVVGRLPAECDLRLLVPDLDLLPRDREPRRPVHAFTRDVPALTASALQATPWLRAVMEAQVDGGATVLVTPSPLIDQGHGEIELRRVLEWANAARTFAANDVPVMTGLSLHRSWMGEAGKRELLLNVLTDGDDDGYYFLVRWAAQASGRNYAQLAEEPVLAGYAETCSVLSDEGIDVLAARNGLAGLVLAGNGASAFSAGVPLSHIYRDRVFIRRARGSSSPQRIDHYLDRRLLSYVPRPRLAAVASIAGPGHCGCSDCAALSSGWQQRIADRHLLRTLTALAHDLGANADRRTWAARELLQAENIVAQNPGLLAAYYTAHLPIWQRQF